jgi:hypothetical protein
MTRSFNALWKYLVERGLTPRRQPAALANTPLEVGGCRPTRHVHDLRRSNIERRACRIVLLPDGASGPRRVYAILRGVDDLAVMDVVGSEPEAELVCSILRDAGIQCMQRITNAGSGAMDGIAIGGPREIIVRADQLVRAREVIREQRS